MNQRSHVKHQAERKLQTCKDRVKEIQVVVTELEKKVEETKAKADSAAQTAMEVCDRIETKRSCKNIESEIAKLKRTIRHQQPSRDEQVAIEAQYEAAMEKYKSTTTSIKQEFKALKVVLGD